MTLKFFAEIFKKAVSQWVDDKSASLAASLAFYTVFSIAPLLLILISIAGVFFGKDFAQGEIFKQVSDFIGKQDAETIKNMIEGLNQNSTNFFTTFLGFITLLFASTRVFSQLQDAMNEIWKVKTETRHGLIFSTVLEYFSYFFMILATGIFILISLFFSVFLAMATEFFTDVLPTTIFIWRALDFLLSLVLTTLVFAMIFKTLPNTKIQWKDVWVGSVLTTLLFLVGRFFISFYLKKGNFGSVYGTASSFVAVLLWIYYSTQILLLGAEFTQVYTKRLGSHSKITKLK